MNGKKNFRFKGKLDNKLLGKKVNNKVEDGQAKVKKYKSIAKRSKENKQAKIGKTKRRTATKRKKNENRKGY